MPSPTDLNAYGILTALTFAFGHSALLALLAVQKRTQFLAFLTAVASWTLCLALSFMFYELNFEDAQLWALSSGAFLFANAGSLLVLLDTVFYKLKARREKQEAAQKHNSDRSEAE